jgi:surface protein
MSIVFTLDLPDILDPVQLPLSGNVNVTIDWGDGSSTQPYISNYPSHTYTIAGIYDISVNGSFTTLGGLYDINTDQFQYLTNFRLTKFQYNIQIPELTSFCSAFSNIENNFTISIADDTITNNVTIMNYMFYGAYNFDNPLTYLNTSNVIEMNGMFIYARSFNRPLTNFNTSQVTIMSNMFNGAYAFNQSLTNFNTSQVTTMSGMFSYASAFNQDISSWNTSQVTDMSDMFDKAVIFNQNISSWNTSSVTNMSGIFSRTSTFNQDLSSWNTSSVTTMYYMFSEATAFNQDLSSWNISSLTDAENMFNDSGLSSSNYNNLLVGWGNQSNIQNSVTFGAPNIKYTTSFAKAAHDILTNNYTWNIIDGGYSAPYPCFKEGSKILTNIGYKPIENLITGDLIKTSLNGYKPIHMIGKRELYHSPKKKRVKDQLYLCSSLEYPEIFEDLVLTGCHCILVDDFKNNIEREHTININGDTYVTDCKYRLPACIDDRTIVYKIPGKYKIYHLALESENNYTNYGIYANGLLVETCSKRYLNEFSEMTII